MSKILFTTSLGVGFLLSELDPKIKLGACVITALPGIIEVTKGYRRFRKVNSALGDSIRARKESERELSLAWDEVDKQRAEIEQQLIDVRQQLERMNLQRDEDTKTLTQLAIEIDAERDKLRKLGAEELEQQKLQLEQTLKSRLGELATLEIETKSELAQARADWKAQKTILRAELEQQKQLLEVEIAQKEALLEAEFNRMKTILATERQNWEDEKAAEEKKLKAKLEEISKKFEQEINQERQEFEASIESEQDKIFKGWEEQNKKVIHAAIIKQLKPAQDRISKLEAELKETRGRLRLKTEEVMKLQKPPKVKGMEPRNLIAKAFQEFYEKRNIDIEITNSMVQRENTIIRYKVWHNVPHKELQKHWVDLRDEFKLSDDPIIGTSDEGYEIVLKPLSLPFMGAVPRGGMDSKDIAQMYDLNLDTPPSNDASYSVNAIAKVLNEQNHRELMLSFVEPEHPLNKPVAGSPITDRELKYIEFLIKWRQLATGQPNVTQQNEIIRRVWGVAPGRGTDSEIDGDSLRDRLKQIFDVLEIPYRTRTSD